MNLFNRRNAPASGRSDLLGQLERLLKHIRIVPLAAPVLLFAGFGLGKVTTRALELPARAAMHDPDHAREVPRVQIEALTRSMSTLRVDGARTVDYVTLYRNHILPVEQVLRQRGISGTTARRMAWPLVQHANRKGLDPAMVVSVLLVESEGNPHATNGHSGARGLMQVMPFWAGQWRGCGTNLYSIDDNLCTGTSILAWYIDHNDANEHRALLGYNGCVHGTVTPDCHKYPLRIERLRQQIDREIQSVRQRPPRILYR
jgi:hypothetical protein